MLTLAYRCRLIAAMVSRAGASASQGHRLSRDLSVGSVCVGSVLLSELVEQRLGVLEVGCGETFSEQAIDRRQQVAGFGAAALVAAEPGKAHSGAQFPELGPLLPGDAQRLAIQFLGSLGMPLPQQQLALVPAELGGEPARPCSFNDPRRVLQQGQALFNLTRDLECPR